MRAPRRPRPRRSGSARRRSRRTTSTARCCSRARAWRWTTRRRRAATCSRRCSRARRRSACCAATATRWPASHLSPDGRTLAFLDNDGTLRLVDTRTRRPVARPLTVSGLLARPRRDGVLQFSDDGSRLAVGGTQPVVLDARTHRVVARLPAMRRSVHRRPALLGGRAHAVRRHRPRPPDRTAIQRFDARSGRPLGALRHVGRSRSPLVALMIHARRPARGDELAQAARPWSATPAPCARCGEHARLDAAAEPAALSPDDRTLLLGGRDGSVRFLDLGDRRGPRRLRTPRRRGRARGVQRRRTHRRHGRRGPARDRLERRRAAAARRSRATPGRSPDWRSAATAETLYSVGAGRQGLIWDLAGDRRLGRPFDVATRGERESLSDVLEPRAAARRPGPRRRAARRDRRRSTPRRCGSVSSFRAVPNGPVRGMAYVPGGRLLVVGGDDGFLALFDPAPRPLVKRLGGHRDAVLTPAFSADGRLMATADAGDAVQLWTLRAGDRSAAAALLHLAGCRGVSLSPDGRTLAVAAGWASRSSTWPRCAAARRCPAPRRSGRLRSFTPDGRFLVGGSVKGWARLWSTETWRPATPAARRTHRGGALASTSPDGRMLATGSTDGTIRLFDLRTQQPSARRCPAFPTARSPRCSRPTAPTCSRSPTPGAPTAGTSARRRGRGTRAPSPAAAHPDRVERRAPRARLRARLLARIRAGHERHLPSYPGETTSEVVSQRWRRRPCRAPASAGARGAGPSAPARPRGSG